MEAALKCLSSTLSVVSNLLDVLEQKQRELKRWELMMRVVAKELHINFSTMENFHHLPDLDDTRDFMYEFGMCLQDALNALKDQARQ